jgi:hypothetical protein
LSGARGLILARFGAGSSIGHPAPSIFAHILKLLVKRARNRNEDVRDQEGEPVELFFFARFLASSSQENTLQEALKEIVVPSCEEAGCLSIHAFRSTSDWSYPG